MSTQDPNVPYGTTAERLKAFALNDDARDRIASLASRYWEMSAYAGLVLFALVFRVWNLGARAMHHDESLHAYYADHFQRGLGQFFTFNSNNIDTWKHVPFMHGPFQFLASGLIMWVPFIDDGEAQSRLLAAAMGTALVFLPWFLRKQLGTVGALMVAVFIAISPTLTYYSRFTREDIYTAFWTLGMVVWMWRYLATQENKFLYLTAGFMAGSFLTKETTYLTVASFVLFVDFALAVRFADHFRERRKWNTPTYVAAIIGFSFVAWAIAVAWPFLEDWRRREGLDEMPAEGNLLIVMGTLAVPMYAAVVQMIPVVFSDEWRNRNYEASAFNLHPAEARVAYGTIVLLIGASVTFGLLWRPKIWAIAAAAFWVPYFLLATTFLANHQNVDVGPFSLPLKFPGFFSVLWGSMDYWISQQDVRRGSQPNYYYFVTIPVYEFLPLMLSIAAMAYYGIRGRLNQAAIVAAGAIAIVGLVAIDGGPHLEKASLFNVWLPFFIAFVGCLALPMPMLNRFLIFWLLSSAFGLTIAGEKMPWLNVHIALPLTVLAGKFVGDVLTDSDLREDLPALERAAPFLYAGVASALAILVFVLVGWRSPASIGAWMLAVVAAISVVWAFASYSRKTAIQVALAGFVCAFAVFTLRATVLSSFGHPDVPQAQAGYSEFSNDDDGDLPIELLVYTQTSGDIPAIKDLIDDYAAETGLGAMVPIVIDSSDGFTWPWAWYLRDYRNVSYVTMTADYKPVDPNSVILASKNVNAGANFGGNYDQGQVYHHRRWFPEEYRGANGVYTTHDFFGDLFSTDALKKWLDFWVRRTPPNTLGTVDGVAFFPTSFEGVPTEPVGPTVRPEGSQLVIGGNGAAPGQLSGPSDVALDAAGNIYVADTNNNRIQKYDPQGNYLAKAGGFGGELLMNQPWSMVVAPDGTVFVADTWNHKIIKLDSELKQVKTWGEGAQTEAGGDPFGLFGPREIALAPNGNVLIADTGNNRIVEYTADGDDVRQFGGKGTSGDDKFNEPVGIVVAPNGDIYVADYWNKRIMHYDANFDMKQQIAVDAWGSQAVTDRPYLALLPDGRLLATEPAGGKVLVFGADGAAAGEYPLPVDQLAGKARPIGIATDGSSVLVADSLGNLVRKIPLSEIAP